jgi:cytochrome c oxidase subunit 3
MWIFLVTEVMFFGGLFTAYIIYRHLYTDAFTAAHHQLSWKLGGLNTFLLLSSSLTMALAVRSSMLGRWRAQMGFLGATWLGALGFMVIKYFEYKAKIDHHLVPGPNFHMEGVNETGAQLFFSLYFAMTGLHGFHVLVGMIVIGALIVRTYINRHKYMDYMPIEMTGLYWHFVDLVWIFLYPLLYLVGQIDMGSV